jgi:putative sterol carrier protein
MVFMPTATEDFFAELTKRGHEPLLSHTAGSIRFDIGTESRPQWWLVKIDKGDISVSRRQRAADCTVRTAPATFDNIVTGADNATAAFLRGEISAEGDYELLQLFQRVFPGPADSTRPQMGR